MKKYNYEYIYNSSIFTIYFYFISEVSPYAIGTVSDGLFVGSEDESIAPPYMPIQGTRRPTSLEKGKKSKKSKDGCKTQWQAMKTKKN